MSLLKVKKLYNKLKNFNLIIFDLDDTIYNSFYFDNPAYEKISNLLNKKLGFNKKLIIKKIFKEKKFEKKNNLNNKIFNKVLGELGLVKDKAKFEKLCIKIYQNNKIDKIDKKTTLIDLISKLHQEEKKLFLVTNGNFIRQKNKIKSLGIKKYFDKIFILDKSKNNSPKPSIKNVKVLRFKSKKNNSIMIGDSVLDKKFARNLGIRYIKFVNDF